MIKYGLLAVLVVLVVAPGRAQFEQMLMRTVTEFRDVEVVGAWAFVCGEHIVQRSTDGGLSWRPALTEISTTFIRIAFVDADHGYVVGYERSNYPDSNGVVYRTTDGGETFTKDRAKFPTPYAFHAVDSSAWMSCAKGKTFYTADAGLTWTMRPQPYFEPLLDYAFTTTSDGWAAGPRGLLLHTTNAGMTWREIEVPKNAAIADVEMHVDGHGWAVGDSMTILKTTDAGATWTSLSTKANVIGGRYARVASDGAYIAVTLRPYLYVSKNAGVTWESQGPDGCVRGNPTMLDVEMVGSILHVAGEAGLYRKFDIGADTKLLATELMVGTDQMLDVGVQSCSVFSAAGKNGNVYTTFNGGKVWCVTLTSAGAEIRSVVFVEPGSLWVVGRGDGSSYTAGVLRHSTNAGISWAKLVTDPMGGLHEIQFADAMHGWIAADSGIVYKTVTGGLTWRKRTTPATTPITDIDFTDSLIGWAISYDSVLHTTDGGDTWQTKLETAPHALRAIAAVDRSTIIVAYGTVVYISYDGLTTIDTLYECQASESTTSIAVNANVACGAISLGSSVLTSEDGFRTYKRQVLPDKKHRAESVVFDGCSGFIVAGPTGFLYTLPCGTVSVVATDDAHANNKVIDYDADPSTDPCEDFDLLGRSVDNQYVGVVLRVRMSSGSRRVEKILKW